MICCLQVYENVRLIPASYQISKDSATESPLSGAQTSSLTARLRGLYEHGNTPVMQNPSDCESKRLSELIQTIKNMKSCTATPVVLFGQTVHCLEKICPKRWDNKLQRFVN